MSDRVLLATFDHEDDLLNATFAVRQKGWRIVDAFTPYAVHGLDRAMGLKQSRLTYVCFVFGMLGAVGMLSFEHWVAAVTWPIDVGGKPWNSLPSDVPVAFEAAVLLAGVSSVLALFGVSRLFPGKQPHIVSPRTTDDQFVLVIEESDAKFDVSTVNLFLQQFNVIETEERISNQGQYS